MVEAYFLKFDPRNIFLYNYITIIITIITTYLYIIITKYF